MDAPPPSQPDTAAAPPPPSSTSDSAPPQAPPTNPTPPTSIAAPPTSDPPPVPIPAPAPAQTLEPPTPNPASVRPPPPRMRPPYTHLASPITMSSSSSPATAAASSFTGTSPMPRGGVAIGLPAHPRGPQTPVGYAPFVPPPQLAHQFNSMHRGPDQPPPPAPQLRQPAPGIQNIGMIGSLNTSQIRPGATSGPQQPRPGLALSAAASPSGSQMPGSQKTPTQALTRPLSGSSSLTTLQQTTPNVSSQFRPQQRPQVPQPRPYHAVQSAPVASHQQNVLSGPQQQQQLPQHQILQQQQQQNQQQHSLQQNQQNTTPKNQQQATRTPLSLAQKPDSPATLQATNKPLLDMASADAAAGESSSRLLSKRSIHELLAQIDPSEKLDPEVEDVLIDIAEDFVESVATFACSLAKHRKSSTLEAKDVLLHAEKSWNITLPGFTGDEIKLYKKQHVNDIHRERLTLIKKSMASEGNTKSSASQAAANQKNQTPKPPAPASP